MNVVWDWGEDVMGSWFLTGLGLILLFKWQGWSATEQVEVLLGLATFAAVLGIVRWLRRRRYASHGG